jgi:hypothetical protein
VVVCGVTRDATGSVCEVVIADCARPGEPYALPAPEFERRWAGAQPGESGVMISAVPATGRPIAGADGVFRSVESIWLPGTGAPSAVRAVPVCWLIQLTLCLWRAMSLPGTAGWRVFSQTRHAVKAAARWSRTWLLK